MPRQLGVGGIGLHEGRTMLVALSTRTNYARPVGACDLSAEKVESARRVFPDLFCTTSYEELLACDEVDIVCIFTPDPLHGEHILGPAMGHYGVHKLPSARNAIELVLYGSEGTSLAQYPDMRYYHTGPDGAEVKEDWLYSKRVYYFNAGSMRPSRWPAGEFEAHGMHYGEFANYVDYFALALLEDRDYSPNLEEGLHAFCVMEAIRRSAESGQPVKITPLLETIGL